MLSIFIEDSLSAMLLVFIVLEGFSGTGKTTLSKLLEKRGWMRIAESAHILPNTVPVADRGDTFSDISLIGATMQFSSMIASNRAKKRIVAEGYLISDLTYAKIRYELGMSIAFPYLYEVVKGIMHEKQLEPDIYFLLSARDSLIYSRQKRKSERDRNINSYFRKRYYQIINELHHQFGNRNIRIISTESDPKVTLQKIINELIERGLIAKE